MSGHKFHAMPEVDVDHIAWEHWNESSVEQPSAFTIEVQAGTVAINEFLKEWNYH